MVFAVAAITAIGVGFSIYSQVEASSARKSANKRAARIEAVRAQREQVQALRQNRISRGRIFAQAGSQGVVGSSPVQGATGAIASDTSASMGFASQVDALSQQRLNDLSRADQWGMFSQIGDSFTQLGVAADQFLPRTGGT